MDLLELFDSIDDITDPSSLDMILMYLQSLDMQDEQFMELLVEKLPYMEITWEQPWYQESNSVTRPVMLNGDVENNFRTDRLTTYEMRSIHKNWRKLRKHFGIPNHLECFARWKNTSKSRNPNTPEERVRHFVIAYLARGLERSLFQVYKHVLTHYGCPNKGLYSLQEEKLLEVCFYHNARNTIPILSKVLGRESRGIYKKLHEWSNGSIRRKRIKWTLPMASKLLKHLIEYTEIPLEELKYKAIDRAIWIKLEKEMNHPYMYLQQFWCNKLHVQIFVKKDIKIGKVRKRIALKLQEYPYKAWRDIRWKELLKDFPDGFTDGFLYRTWIPLFKDHKEYHRIPLHEVIEYALERIPMLPNRRLRTLIFNGYEELCEFRYD